MAQPQTPFQLVRAKYLIDGKGGAPVENGAVLLEGARVRAAGPARSVAAPEGAPVEVHEFPDGAILPGLIDVHTHLNYPGDGTHTNDVMKEGDDILLMQSIVNAHSYLLRGVTTMRDNGAKNNTTFSLREGIRRGLAQGPRLVLCGNPLTITGGHMWQMGAEADGVNEVTKGVRRLIQMGADYIKVAVTGGTTLGTYPNLPSYNLEEVQGIVWEAHKFQRLVAAHAHATQGILNALDAGIDMIIHCTWREPDGTSRYREDVAARIAEVGAWVNPTLYQMLGGTRERLLQKKESAGLTPSEQARLDDIQRFSPQRLDQIRKMKDAGVKFVTGTDCGWGEMPFDRIHREMDLFVQAGFTPAQAILTATRDAAGSLGLGHLVGTLEPGKEADVAVFRGAPHRDVNDIANVLAVFQAGHRVR
ncbi:MAG: amidohydrolase family protein [Chloroflexi bacterium]|nr:amidohydrolase family protein [Chloroflexota bacterium]